MNKKKQRREINGFNILVKLNRKKQSSNGGVCLAWLEFCRERCTINKINKK